MHQLLIALFATAALTGVELQRYDFEGKDALPAGLTRQETAKPAQPTGGQQRALLVAGGHTALPPLSFPVGAKNLVVEFDRLVAASAAGTVVSHYTRCELRVTGQDRRAGPNDGRTAVAPADLGRWTRVTWTLPLDGLRSAEAVVLSDNLQDAAGGFAAPVWIDNLILRCE